MKRECPLDAHAERLLSNRERLTDARALALDDDALEDLDPAALSLDDLEVDTDGVAGLELRPVWAQLFALECLDGIRHGKGSSTGPTAGC